MRGKDIENHPGKSADQHIKKIHFKFWVINFYNRKETKTKTQENLLIITFDVSPPPSLSHEADILLCDKKLKKDLQELTSFASKLVIITKDS